MTGRPGKAARPFAGAAMQVRHAARRVAACRQDPPPMEKVTPPMEKVTPTDGKGHPPPMEKVTPPVEKVTPLRWKRSPHRWKSSPQPGRRQCAPDTLLHLLGHDVGRRPFHLVIEVGALFVGRWRLGKRHHLSHAAANALLPR